MAVAALCQCCGPNPCTIFAAPSFTDLTGLTEIGTVTVAAGVAELESGEGLIVDAAPTNYYDPVIFTITASTEDSSGTIRLAVAYEDSDNYLFGEYSFSGSTGTLRLGKREGGSETWLTDAVTVEDTTDLGDLTTLILCWVPGAVQTGGEIAVDLIPFQAEGGDGLWSDEEEALEEDDTPAVWFNTTAGETTAALAVRFLGALPPGTTIDGIEIGVRCRTNSPEGDVTVTLDQLWIGGTPGDVRGGDTQIVPPAGDPYGDLGSGGPTDDWNAELTWQQVNAGINVLMRFKIVTAFGIEGVDVLVDVVTVRLYCTTPDRQPGRLTLSRGNVTAMTVDCARNFRSEAPGDGKLALVSSGAGEWHVSALEYAYHLSDSKPGCGTCECTVETFPCQCCDEELPVAGELLADFGTGWSQAGSSCDLCDVVSGEVLLPSYGSCAWSITENFISGGVWCQVWIDLKLLSNGEGQCRYLMYVHVVRYVLGDSGWGLSALSFAWYESAPIESDECQVFPVTMTLQTENKSGGGTDCDGNLPGTITLDEP